MGGFWLLNEQHVGDYKKAGQVMDKIYSRLLGEDTIETSRGFGLYYDYPKKVKKENLRSVVAEFPFRGGCASSQVSLKHIPSWLNT